MASSILWVTIKAVNSCSREIGLLSGGQRQAITLLMATLQRPDLILLDEHTAALDPKTSLTVMGLTERLIREQELTAFMVTHNMEAVLQIVNQSQHLIDFPSLDLA
jgi:putative ABC transport system ATP-binding protein